MKKIFALSCLMTFLFLSCDLIKNAEENKDQQDLKSDASLKSLLINGSTVILLEGQTDYDYYLCASNGLTTSVEITATANNSLASISGTGGKVVNNPAVATPVSVDAWDYQYDINQSSIDTDFVISIESEDKSNTQRYNLKIHSAPVWAKIAVNYNGNAQTIENKTANIVVSCFPGRNYQYKYSAKLKGLSSQVVYIPFPVEEDLNAGYSKYSIDLDGNDDGGHGFGDYSGDVENNVVKLSKTKIFEIVFDNSSHINRIKVVNIPSSLIDDAGYSNLILKNKSTGVAHNHPWGDVSNNIYSLFNTYLGDFDVYLTRDTRNTASEAVVRIGDYAITEFSDIELDLSGKTVETVGDLGPSVVNYDLGNDKITFSHSMNRSSLANALRIRDISGRVYVPFTVTWSDNDTVATIVTNPDLDGTKFYEFHLDTNATSSTGQKLMFKSTVYFP